jgi:hypothetical protein
MSKINECGCCAGTDAEVPAVISNLPSLSRISYCVGEHGSFKETMLAHLSNASVPALRDLSTRGDDDFTIALCDAHATMLDILTFYQERIANENFLRTATERRSILELARLIGYQLAPGVAASTYLSFILQESPGAAEQKAEPVKIPVGTRVQSVPGPDEKPQSFETVEEITGRVEWNSIQVQTTERHIPAAGDTEMYLAGINTRLQPGDIILIVGADRERNLGSERWDVRLLHTVEADATNDKTRITWIEGLGYNNKADSVADEPVHIFAFRQRASLFGHNAPDPNLFSTSGTNISALTITDPKDATKRIWNNFEITKNKIDLDGALSKLVSNSWFALINAETAQKPSSLPGYVELYRAKTVEILSRTDFGLTGKITRIIPDTEENLDKYRKHLKETLVLAESEELFIAERPTLDPLCGITITLAVVDKLLSPRQVIAISGKRARIAITNNGHGKKSFTPVGEDKGLEVKTGDEFIVLSPFDSTNSLSVEDLNGRPGSLNAITGDYAWKPAKKEDKTVSEIAVVSDISDSTKPGLERTTLTLLHSVKYCYDRATVAINANLARATHGESVVETLGSGSAMAKNQRFELRQSPLTYVSAKTASGRISTLEVRVNGVLWQEVPSLFGCASNERIYTTFIDDDGNTTIIFGDGVEGSRIPSGQDNVRSRYRKSLGVAGNLAAGKLTNLLSRPLGVSGANNPEAASGGEDPESLSDARRNAPLTILTLDRAVSVQDYQDYARTFAGIAKAHAIWIPAGPAKGVFLSVNGVEGAVVVEDTELYKNLAASLRAFGDPLLAITIKSNPPALFTVKAVIRVAPERDSERVLRDAKSALFTAFSFKERDFGQSVSLDEISAILTSVLGVEAAHIIKLYKNSDNETKPRLFAALPKASLSNVPKAAELLLIDQKNSNVEVIS